MVPGEFPEEEKTEKRLTPEQILGREDFKVDSWPAKWKMWSSEWDKDSLIAAIKETDLSPKFLALKNMINMLDQEDMKTDQTTYKHAIFCNSSRPRGAVGPLALGCCFRAFGWVWIQDVSLKIVTEKAQKLSRHPKFAILTQENLAGNEEGKTNTGSQSVLTSLVGEIRKWCDFTPEQRKQIEAMSHTHSKFIPKRGLFNDRLFNLFGEICRFLLFDRNYTEGVDLFDAKYLHVFTPQLSTCLMTQAVGRITRSCGMIGLGRENMPRIPAETKFHGKVHVLVYSGVFSDRDQNLIEKTTPFELAQQYTDKLENLQLVNTCLNLMVLNSVDWYFSHAIHQKPGERFGFNEKTGELIGDVIHHEAWNDQKFGSDKKQVILFNKLGQYVRHFAQPTPKITTPPVSVSVPVSTEIGQEKEKSSNPLKVTAPKSADKGEDEDEDVEMVASDEGEEEDVDDEEEFRRRVLRNKDKASDEDL